MLSVLIIITVPVFLGIIFVKPKWGSFLIWPILFTYPHAWWFYRQFLPLNIGMDDLYCLSLFLIVLIRRNFLGGVRIRFGYAFWAVTAFTIIAVIANFTGSIDAAKAERALYWKAIMKFGVYWCLFYAVLHCIDDIRDLRRQLAMFSVGAMAGGVIVILQNFFPQQMEVFAAPIVLETVGVGFGARGSGAFMNPNTAACMLGCSLMLVITAIRLQQITVSRTFIYTFIFVLLIAMLFTRSRAGFMAFGMALLLMGIFGRGKKFAWVVITAAIVLVLILPEARNLYIQRIKETYDPSSGTWGANVTGRVAMWKSYIRTTTVKDYLLGQGATRAAAKNAGESHSVYVSLLTIYGIGGVIWALIALIIFLRKAFVLRHFPDPLVASVGAGCIWALIVWGIYSTSADAISAQYPLYLLFYLVVLLDRAYIIAGEQQEFLLYEQEASLPMGYPLKAGVEIY